MLEGLVATIKIGICAGFKIILKPQKKNSALLMLLIRDRADAWMTRAPAGILLRNKYANHNEHYSSKGQHDHLGICAHPKIPPIWRCASCHPVEGPTGSNETKAKYYGHCIANVHRTISRFNAVTAIKSFERVPQRERERYLSSSRKGRKSEW